MSASTAQQAAEGDNKSGQQPSMVNPHNPEFITKKPWYLGDSTDEPTLEHQTAPTLHKKTPLSLAASEAFVAQQRIVQDKFEKGQWVEALKKNKLPYRICLILSVKYFKNQQQQPEFDLKYEDGTIERRVKLYSSSHPGGSSNNKQRPRVRRTQRGTRSGNITAVGNMVETYDSKRDKYHGYNPESHNATLTARFEERERLRRKIRESLKLEKRKEQQQQQNSKNVNGSEDGQEKAAQQDGNNNQNKEDEVGAYNNDNDDDVDDDEYLQNDEDDRVITTRLARQGGVGGAQMKVTARNLRIREDTAKYLRNLDPNSAYYDPKSRSMRDNPNPEMNPDESQFAGDNFCRISGDAVQLADSQLFAWEAAEKGVDEVHPQANPSQVELLKKQYRTKAKDLKVETKKAILSKYGGEEYLDGSGGLASVVENKNKPSRAIRFGASTKVETYNPDGQIANGTNNEPKHVAIPSKYEEDIFINGHYSVWGSYFHKGAFQWGYADDHSLLKMSYCTGEAGRLANDEANELQYGTGQTGSAELAQARKMLQVTRGSSKQPKDGKSVANPLNRSRLYGEADIHQTLDADKVKAAMEKARKEEQQKNRTSNTPQEHKKRKYNSMKSAEAESMTAEEMEAYRLAKDRKNDPMANFGGNDNDDNEQLLEYDTSGRNKKSK